MSLAVLADHLAAKGRNGDSMLVHMSPEEVRGLHALALVHGEQMTINPETGLPEAFSLKSILKAVLPVVAGYFLGPSGYGIVNSALGAAAVVGGATALATGSLKEGFVAGMGAYGGFGLGEGLSGAAAASVPAETAAANALGVAGASAAPGSQAAMLAAQNAGFGAEGLNQLAQSAAYAQGAAPVLPSAMSGLEALGTEQGRKGFMQGVGGMSGLAKYGYAALAPTLSTMASQQVVPNMPNMLTPYTMRYRPVAVNQFGMAQPLDITDVLGANSGGLVALADGGSTSSPGLTMADVRRMYQEKGGYLPTPASQQPVFQANISPSSKKIQDYLMGRGPYPVNPTLPEGTPLFKPYYESVGMVKPATTSTTNTTQTTPTVLKDPQGNPYSPFATSYFSANPDVRQAYETQVMGQMSPDAYVQFHWNTYGQREGRKGYFGSTSTVAPSGIGGGAGAGGGGGNAFGGGAMGAMGVGTMGIGALSGAGTSGGNAGEEDTSRSLSGGIIPFLVNRPAGEAPAPVVDYSRPATDIQFPDTSRSLSGGIIPFLVDRPAGEAPAPVVDLNPPMGGSNFNDFDFAGGYWGDPGYSNMFNSGGMTAMAHGGDARYNLGGYSDGGRLLRGPGDGVSDDIPATIGDRQPARLADGEFVVPARIVSELGNGSTEAGARQLYAMMDRVQRARSKTMGEDRVAANTNAAKFLPA